MFSFSSIQDYRAQLLSGSCSCEDAVHFYLQQIAARPSLNAYVRVYGEEALQRARQLDEARKKGAPMGKLHGVVVAIKDVICYKDHPVSAASRILQNFTSIYSATVVERLLAEEAIIIGHVNCDEFAMGSTNEHSAYGRVLNPLDETRVPGGSSGGSAAAVAAGLCMVSLGSDTGGSVRQPADFCGLVGLKPTYGRVSRYGLLAYASSFDQVGIIGKTVPDVAAVLEVIAGPDNLDATASLEPVPAFTQELPQSPYRIAYFNDAIDHPGLDPEIKANFLSFFDRLEREGHYVQGINFDYLDYIIPAYYILTTAEASSNLARYDGIKYGSRLEAESSLTGFYKKNRSAGFGAEVKRRILLGTFVLSAGYYDAYFEKAQTVRKKILEKTLLIFKEFDAVILPVSPAVAYKTGEKSQNPISMYLADIYTVYANLTGVPAISVPLFLHSTGLPYGPQIMTNRFQELYLLQFANYLMSQYKSFD